MLKPALASAEWNIVIQVLRKQFSVHLRVLDLSHKFLKSVAAYNQVQIQFYDFDMIEI